MKFPVLIGLILILGFSFLIGLGLRAETGRRMGRWIERAILERMPAYKALKSLTTGFTEAGRQGAFKAAVVNTADGNRELAYVIEDLGDDHLTIRLPWAPTAFAGSVKIVNRNQVELLNANIGEVSKVLSHWGVGANGLLHKVNATTVYPSGSTK